MRTAIKMMLLPISLWVACSNQQKQVRDFIPGTYVNHAQSAYSIADDTLVITPASGAYRVTRRTGFRRLPNGAPQYKTKTFTATWDEQRGNLQLTQNGLIILFQPGGNQLEIADSKYRKL